ncbi:hypothetical protein EDD22DRAFT_736934, partial [Suillus occidentalis]
RVCCWAHLQLPNGQTCQLGLFSERNSTKCSTCAHNIRSDHQTLEPLALVSVYSPPDWPLLQESNNTFYTCKHQGEVGLRVVHVKTFLSV